MDNILGMDICSHIRLSIILPVYNAEKYLYSCLSAISRVKNKDIEILLIDDGSTDKSGTLCDEFSNKDARFRVFHKNNGGVSSARNFALAMAKGEWVTFVDADDEPTEYIITFHPKQDIDLVCFNWQYTTGEKEDESLVDGIYINRGKIDFLNRHLVDFVFRTPWAKLFQRNVRVDNNILFNENCFLGEDNLFVLDFLYRCGHIETNHKLGYIYLRPSQSKYHLSLSYSMSYMTLFMEKYLKLNVDCKALLQLLDYYYFYMVGDNSAKAKIKWEQCKGIKDIRKICSNNYSLKCRAKILFYNLLSYVYGE